MAKVAFGAETITGTSNVQKFLNSIGIPYECWGVRELAERSPENVLKTYASDVTRLKAERGYRTEDIVALDTCTPNLEGILAKFDKEHHHTDDEVRFVVDGEGVFEINTSAQERVKITAEPGDLIVIPAYRRHLFYLTEKKNIRCIRLFKDQSGWEAHYQYQHVPTETAQPFFG